MTDLQLAQRIGEKVTVVRNIQLNSHTTTVEVLRKICEELQCQPGVIMEAIQVEIIPAPPPMNQAPAPTRSRGYSAH